MYFFVWVLYKLQFKVNWKHTLWNLSLLVVTLLDLTMNFAGFVPIWNPILTSKENKWQKCVWKTSVTYFNFSQHWKVNVVPAEPVNNRPRITSRPRYRARRFFYSNFLICARNTMMLPFRWNRYGRTRIIQGLYK